MNPSVRKHRVLLRSNYEDRKDDIRQRLNDFSNVPATEYFYELAYCILTPQSRARHAESAVSELKARNFASAPFDPEPLLREASRYVRFHRTKSARLLRLVQGYPDIEQALSRNSAPSSLRDWLVDHVDGFGMKEATHFLRNIGRNGGLAILDRHILRHLVLSGVLHRIPTSLTRSRYLEIEKRFAGFARNMGIRLDELDLLFWSLQTGEILK